MINELMNEFINELMNKFMNDLFNEFIVYYILLNNYYTQKIQLLK